MAVPSYGLDAELAAKAAAKYDTDLETRAAEWIEAVTGVSGIKGNFAEALKDGVTLCKLLNRIKPSTIEKINESSMAFKQRENISKFVSATQTLGVHNNAVFGPDDLFEQRNMGSVLNCIWALGGAVQVSVPEFTGPKFGIADTSAVKHDVKRSSCIVTQTGGLAATCEKTELHASKNVARGLGAPAKARQVGGYQGDVAPILDGGDVEADAQGLDRDFRAKQAAKNDVTLEDEAALWIEAITGEAGVKGNFAEALKSGVVLCKLLNTIKPDTIRKINEQKMPFMQRENISNFLTAVQTFGVHNSAVFSPDDLFEQKNMGSVVNCIFALGGAIQTSVPSFNGPRLGIADKSKAQQDRKRSVGPATQTGGLHCAMDKLAVDASANIVKNTGGATSAGGQTRLGQGAAGVMERAHLDRSHDIDAGAKASQWAGA